MTKFTYLKGLLQGEAKSCIEGLTLTSENYKIACEILKQRFGRKELVVFSHIQSLLALKPAESLKDNLSKLKNLLDQVNIHVRSLGTLGIDGETYGIMLTPVILSRLPAEVRMEWAREGQNKEGDLEFLLDFLQKEIERMERANTFKLETAESEKSAQEERNQKFSSNGNTKKTTTSALHSVTEKVKWCVFCSRNNHWSSECYTAKKLTPENQKTAVIKGGLCFRCLTQGHLARSCESVCDVCQGNHHKILCRKESAENRETEKPEENSEETESTESSVNISCLSKAREHQVLLQTAKVKVKGPKRQIVYANVLFDSGSDQSYVSSDFSRKLNLRCVEKIEHKYATFGGNQSQTDRKAVREIEL